LLSNVTMETQLTGMDVLQPVQLKQSQIVTVMDQDHVKFFVEMDSLILDRFYLLILINQLTMKNVMKVLVD